MTSPTTARTDPHRPVQRIARWSATHPGRAIGAWLLLVVALTSLAASVPAQQATDAERGVGESGEALVLLEEMGFPDHAQENVLVTSESGAPDIAAATSVLEALGTRLADDDAVRSVGSPLVAPDGTAVLLPVELRDGADDARPHLPDLEAAVDEARAEARATAPDLRVELVGDASIGADLDAWLGEDLEKAGLLSLPVTLGVLLLAFGALVMAGVPLLLGVTSVASAFGLWSVVSHVVPDPGMVLHIILLIGMAVGVDYSLFYVRRFREERDRGHGPVDAVTAAAATAGHSIVVSGTAVVLAMAGLLVVRDAVFTGMAVGAILVVLVALVSSLTVLPAILVKVGRFVDRPRVPLLGRLTARTEPRLVPAVLRPVVRRPLAAAVLAIAALGALAVPALGMDVESPQIEDYPRELASLQAYDRLVAAFPDETESVTVVARTEEGGADDAIAGLAARVAERPDLYGTLGEPWTTPDGAGLVMDVAVPHGIHSAEARDAVTTLRDEIVPATLGATPGVEAAVGGSIAAEMDYTDNVSSALPWVVGAVVLLTFVVMLAAYRSVALAGVTAALNLLSVGATFGMLVLVFQHTWAEGLLGFTSTGHVTPWVPVLLFVVLSGLSLDYHVFVVSRIRELAARGLSADVSVAEGIGRTAGVVTAAATVMVAVFAIFGTLDFIELQQIGIGLSLGVLLDATLIRAVALPSLLLVLRRRLWWPTEHAAPDESRPQPVLASRGPRTT